MAAKTPLALVKEKFGDKAQLVQAVEKLADGDLWLARTNKVKGLAHVSNAKLLRLHETFAEVKSKFVTREKLIDAILELEDRAKDAGMRQRLSEWPVPRLFDAYRSASKRAKAAKSEELAKAPPKKAEPKKQAPVAAKPAKKAAAKKSRK